jgi:hypothetical protein
MNVFFVFGAPGGGGGGGGGGGDADGGGALELVTPPLDDGTILPGVTRESALELARAWALEQEQEEEEGDEAARAARGAEGVVGGWSGRARRRRPLIVRERHVTVRELREAAARGTLREVFGTGTACVVQPVAELVLEAGGGAGGAPIRLAAPESSSSAAAAAAAAAAAPATAAPPGSSGDPSAPLWARLGAALADIQYGRVPGHPWSVRAADLARDAGA